MNKAQIRQANEQYVDMFGDDISEETRTLMASLDDLDDLEEIRDDMHFGEVI